MTIKAAMPAPRFNIPISAGENLSLSDFRGRILVLYFYPRDSTPGCTAEACDFRDSLARLKAMGAEVVGVSKDSLKRHDSFSKKQGLNFPLLSDENSTLCEDYGVWKEKSMYGKKFMAVERTTFLIDGEGVVRKVWNKVKVKGHVEEVTKAVEELQAAASN